MHIATTPELMREVVRLYVRSQRKQARCGDAASTVQCHVLTELLRQDGMAQQALSERLALDKGWISRAVDALVGEGAIVKRASERDRRSVTLSLTPAGRARAEALDAEVNAHASQLLQGIPRERHEQVGQAMRLLLEALAGEAVAFRKASAQDWPAIEVLLESNGLPVAGAREHLALFRVGEEGGRIVCAGGLERYGADALLRSVAVAPGMQGRGLGRRMVARLIQDCRALCVSHLYLLTTSADAYFTKLDFSIVARERIPAALGQSQQFKGACPGDARAMMHVLE